MFVPKKTKYRKCRKGRISGNAKSGYSLSFGVCGLKALGPQRVNYKELEATRRSISRSLKRLGKIWIRVFCHTQVSKKPADVRMGKGKGAVELWVCRVKPGNILFEVGGVSVAVAREALEKCRSKLSVKCKVVCRE